MAGVTDPDYQEAVELPLHNEEDVNVCGMQLIHFFCAPLLNCDDKWACQQPWPQEGLCLGLIPLRYECLGNTIIYVDRTSRSSAENEVREI